MKATKNPAIMPGFLLLYTRCIKDFSDAQVGQNIF